MNPPSEHASQAHPHVHPVGDPRSPAPAEKTTPRAWAIGAILLVFVLIVGVLIFMQLTKGGDEPPLPIENKVQVKLLVDAECEYCFQTNTILAKFDESHIAYDLQTFDVRSPEGKALADEFEIEYVPTALVNIKGLDQNSTIQAALQGQFIKGALPSKKGWVVVAEKFLDKQPHLITFIRPPETCEVPKDEILITAQLDYGDCNPCTEAYNILSVIQDKYANVKIDYSPILYNRTTPKSLLKAVNAGKGAVCAERLGYLDAYTECNYFNTPFYGSPDINQMKSCLAQAGGTSQTTRANFVTCVTDSNSHSEQELVENTETMHQWNPLLYSPSFVIDCQYAFVGQKSIEAYLCSLHPELNCALPTPSNTNASADSSDTNSTPLILTGTPDGNGNTDSDSNAE